MDAARDQLLDIQVATREDGTYLLTKNGAKQFSAGGKKDLAYALIFAYVRFVLWLRLGGLEWDRAGSEDEGYYVMKG